MAEGRAVRGREAASTKAPQDAPPPAEGGLADSRQAHRAAPRLASAGVRPNQKIREKPIKNLAKKAFFNKNINAHDEYKPAESGLELVACDFFGCRHAYENADDGDGCKGEEK